MATETKEELEARIDRYKKTIKGGAVKGSVLEAVKKRLEIAESALGAVEQKSLIEDALAELKSTKIKKVKGAKPQRLDKRIVNTMLGDKLQSLGISSVLQLKKMFLANNSDAILKLLIDNYARLIFDYNIFFHNRKKYCKQNDLNTVLQTEYLIYLSKPMKKGMNRDEETFNTYKGFVIYNYIDAIFDENNFWVTESNFIGKDLDLTLKQIRSFKTAKNDFVEFVSRLIKDSKD